MAGDWTKMLNNLRDCPSVVTIAAALKIDVDSVIGKLHAVWAWAGSQTVTGACANVRLSHLDHTARVEGFGAAMVQAGWLEDKEEGIFFPRWDTHNGKSAKQRLLAAERASRSRNARALQPSRTTVTKAHPEKRREEKRVEIQPPTPKAEPKGTENDLFFPPALDRPEFKSKWREWLAYRKAAKHKPTLLVSQNAQLKRMAKWGIQAATEAIDRSIANQYQGIIDPTERARPPSNGTLNGHSARPTAPGEDPRYLWKKDGLWHTDQEKVIPTDAEYQAAMGIEP